MVWEDLAAQGGLSQAEPTIVDVLSWQTHTEAFQDIGYFWASRPRLAVGDEVVQLQGVELSHNVLDLLGTAPALGRGFLPTETTVNGPRVAMLSHALWVSRFGGDRSVVGQTVMVNDTGHTVVGVLPKTFRFVHMPPVTERPDILTPFQRDPARCRGMSQCYRVSVVGRLADDVTLEHVQRKIAQLAASGRTLVPGRTAAPAFRVMSLQEQTVAAFRPFAMALLGMVALVMLVACANVTNLLLARGEARRHELAVRGAIGATRRRLISQLLTEGLVLGVVGGMVGLVVAAIGTPLLIQRLSRVVDLPRQAAMTVDWRVVAFAMALSVVAGLITGLIPAVRMPSRAAAFLGRRGAGWPHGGGVLHGLAVAQVAGAFILVVGAALLDAGVGSLLQTERGFRSDNVLAAQLQLTGPDYRERADNLAFVARLTDRIRGLPGVESVGATSSVPLDGVDGSVPYRPIGSPISSDTTPIGWFRGATPDYFATMGIEILRGRNVRDTDTADAAPVLVINQAMARRDWPEMDPVGQRLRIGAREFRIVGVVSDVRNFGLDREETPVFYRPLTQGAASYTTMVVKTRTPATLAPALRDAIRRLAPRLAGVSIRPMDELVNASVAPQRITVQLTAVFAGLALALAALGVYGLLHFQVTQRTQEFGVRLALGSSANGIRRAVLARGMATIAGGLVAGLAASLLSSRVLTSLLYGVSAHEPRVFVRAAVWVLAIGLLAVYVPARRASRIAPMDALRSD